jgi:formylglycine-generating enzyme required for sulfatase activity
LKTLLIMIAFIFISQSVFSNNIQVNNAVLTGQVTGANFTLVQFDLSWENSWRDAVNWDAAWVFVKFKASYDTVWKHATLNTVGHNIPSGYTGATTSDGLGIFVYRNFNSSGTSSLLGTQLRWNYGVDGVSDGDLVSVKVFAIEMVYIPQGNFFAGDGTTNNVMGQFSQGNTTAPFLITSEAALTLGGAPVTNLGNRNASGMVTPDDFNYTSTQTLPAAFPKGYNDFYCMKYEISQGQYTDFLNTLTRHQQKSRVESDISGDVVTNIYVMSGTASLVLRNRIICPATGNGTTQPVVFSCDRQDRACNYLSWMDGCAYMDWAGFRPMTELELEKTCRGPLTPVADEYAWGSTNITIATTISGTENGTEYITTAGANSCWNYLSYIGGDGGGGPLRCGIFAKISTTREQAGASYYGVMEMSGNVNERTVTAGNSFGRVFDGLHGNGQLSVNGNANVSNWPGIVGSEVTGAIGSNLRMGSFYSSFNYYLRISERSLGAGNITSRNTYFGFRGVRTSEVGTMNKKNNQKN